MSDYVAGCHCRLNSLGYTLAAMDYVLSHKKTVLNYKWLLICHFAKQQDNGWQMNSAYGLIKSMRVLTDV